MAIFTLIPIEHILSFTNRLHNDYPSLIFGETILFFTNTYKHLGVTFQSSGKWDAHVDEMISKIMKMIVYKLLFDLDSNGRRT